MDATERLVQAVAENMLGAATANRLRALARVIERSALGIQEGGSDDR